MRKPEYVKDDEQNLSRLKGCLRDMRETSEIRHTGETDEQKTDIAPFADLRQLLDKAVVCESGMPYRGEK